MNIDVLIPKLKQLIKEGRKLSAIRSVLQGDAQIEGQKWLTSVDLIIQNFNKDSYEKTSHLIAGCAREGGITSNRILNIIEYLNSLLKDIKRIKVICDGFDKRVTDSKNKVENEKNISQNQQMFRAINRLRFYGIRKLNWKEKDETGLTEHLQKVDLDQWIDLAPLTILIGPNGGGKSTMIDLLRALSNPEFWPTLPRENYPGQDFSGFEIEGINFVISASFTRTDRLFDFNNLVLTIHQKSSTGIKLKLDLPKYSTQPGPWKDCIHHVLDRYIRLKVEHFPSEGPFLADSLTDDNLSKLLTELSPYFPSVFSNKYSFYSDTHGVDRIAVYFKDDPAQPSVVHRRFLPSGWLQLVSILFFIRNCEDGSLVLLDEPDRHLHPSLQRFMLEIIYKEQKKKNIQVLIATHSSVLLNPELLERYHAKVLLAASGRISELSNTRRALDDLGVKSSDLIQANGIIWVEGPSDKIYIKTWLDIYAESIYKTPLVEGVHYSFVSYGGALLKHLTLSNRYPNKSRLDVINNNWFIIIDRDLLIGEHQILQEQKQRLLDEAKEANLPNNVWITQHYTIEDYLPDSFASNIQKNDDGRTCIKGYSKVVLAEIFRKQKLNWNCSFKGETDIPERIPYLYNLIDSWQTPQERIDFPYEPPLYDKFDS